MSLRFCCHLFFVGVHMVTCRRVRTFVCYNICPPPGGYSCAVRQWCTCDVLCRACRLLYILQTLPTTQWRSVCCNRRLNDWWRTETSCLHSSAQRTRRLRNGGCSVGQTHTHMLTHMLTYTLRLDQAAVVLAAHYHCVQVVWLRCAVCRFEAVVAAVRAEEAGLRQRMVNLAVQEQTAVVQAQVSSHAPQTRPPYHTDHAHQAACVAPAPLIVCD